MPKVGLSCRDIQVLNILFAEDKPMTAQDIVRKNDWLPQNTVRAVLNKLYKGGLVEIAGTLPSGGAPARMYRGTVKAREETLQYMLEEYKKVSGVISRVEVIRVLINREPDEKRRIEILREVVEDQENIESRNR